MADIMITTYDNPINPFEDFIGWFKQDMLLGHNTCGLLALYACPDSDLSDEVNHERETSAMEYMVAMEPELFKIVMRDDYFYKNKMNAS